MLGSWEGWVTQGLGAHLFSFPGIIMNSHLFDKCSSSDDIVYDYPSHVSCFSERRGVINESHSIYNVCMRACSSLCVGRKWEEEREGGGVWTERRPSPYLWSSSVGSTQSLLDRKCRISVCVLIYTGRKQFIKVSHIHGLMWCVPCPPPPPHT